MVYVNPYTFASCQVYYMPVSVNAVEYQPLVIFSLAPSNS